MFQVAMRSGMGDSRGGCHVCGAEGAVWEAGGHDVDTLLTRARWCWHNRRMLSTVKKWGNSASIRIPAAVMAAAHLSLDQAVEVREEGGRVVIEPVRPREYALDALLAGITDENRHTPVETGRAMGREAW